MRWVNLRADWDAGQWAGRGAAKSLETCNVSVSRLDDEVNVAQLVVGGGGRILALDLVSASLTVLPAVPFALHFARGIRAEELKVLPNWQA